MMVKSYNMVNSAIFLVVMILALYGCGQNLTDAQHFDKAQHFYKTNDVDAAIIELKNALQKNASNLEARRLLGTIYANIGLGASAEKELRRAIVLGGEEESIDWVLAKAFFLQNKYKEAYEYFNKELRNTSASKRNIILTRAAIGLGKLDTADAHFQNVTNEDKQTLPGQYAGIYMSLAKRDVAVAEKSIAALLEEFPNEIEAWVVRGTLALQQNALHLAEKSFQSAIEKHSSRHHSNLTFNARKGLFFAQIGQKKYEQALKTTNELMSITKDHPIPKYLRGLLAFEQKDYETARTYLDEVYSRLPEHIPTQMMLGSIHYTEKNYEQANRFLTSVISKVPGHVQARKLLAATRLFLNNPTEAMETLEPMVEDNSEDTQLLSMVAAAAIQSGNFQMGEDYLKKAQKSSPDNSSIRAELAKLYLQKGEYDEALKELDLIKGDKAIQADILKVATYLQKQDYVNARKVAGNIHRNIDNATSLSVLGGVELAAGDISKAKGFFQQALSKDKDFIPALLNLGKIEFQLDNVDGAKVYFQNVIKINTNNIPALMGLAQISEKEGDKAKAVEYLEQMRAIDPKTILPRLLLAKYYAQVGRAKEAFSSVSEAYKVAPANPRVALLYASIQMLKKDVSGAIKTLEILKLRQPKSPQLAYYLAGAYSQIHRVGNARSEYKRALSLNPKLIQANVALIRLEIEQKEFKNAFQQVDVLRQIYPKEPIVLLLQGDIHSAMGNLDKAIQSYRGSLKIKASEMGYRKLAGTLRQKNDLKASIATIQDATKAMPQNISLKIYLGSLLQEQKNYSQAARLYEEILAQQPEHVVVLNNLAYLHLEQNKTDLALQYAKKAHAQNTTNPAIADTLGWIYVEKGEIEKALPLLKQAQEDSSNPSIHYHYAVALHKSGDDETARKLLNKVIKESGVFVERQKAKALLDSLK